MSEKTDGGRTCANGCKHAEPWFPDGHFDCRHPATKQIETAMWGVPGFPDDDGALPENTPVPFTDTKHLGHPKDCPAFEREEARDR